MHWGSLIIGVVIGGVLGVGMMCLMAMASRTSRSTEEME